MSAHTPGPWNWDCGIIPPDGPGRYSDIYVDGGNKIIAHFNELRESNPGEGLANAALIAAAPDLLAALELFAHASMSGSNGDGESHIGWQRGEGLSARERVQQARAAILKARGQS